MKTYLLPLRLKNLMQGLKKIAVCAMIFEWGLWFVIGCVGFYKDTTTLIVVSSGFLLITLAFIIPIVAYEKVSQSIVQMDEQQISILNKNGVCWRVIKYEDISDLRVEKITGFFYGQNQECFQNDFICLFSKERIDIPNVPFSKLFSQEDFFMIAYDPVAFDWIYGKLTEDRRFSVLNWKTGDGSLS